MIAEPAAPSEINRIEMPVWSFVIGVVLTSLVFLTFAWQGWQVRQQRQAVDRFSISVTRDASALRHLDNAMIVAAFMASHTNQQDWRERHGRLAKELKKTMARARASLPSSATQVQLNGLVAARSQLTEIEADAFAHLKDGDLTAAQEVLTNPIYASNQIFFGHRMTFFLRNIQGLVEQRTAAVTSKALNLFWVLAGGFGLISIAWFQVYRSQRSFAAENQSLHADMEARVEQRTQSLNEQIIETERTQSALRSREGQLRAVLDNMSDGIFMLDGDLNFITFNQRYIELFGMPPELVEIGKPIRGVLEFAAHNGFYGDNDPEEQIRIRLIAYENKLDYEAEMETQDGRTLSLRKNSVEDGGAVAVISDISERKAAERKLQEDQEQLAAMLDASPIGVSIVDDNNTRIFVNARFAEMYGGTKEALMGDTAQSTFADEQSARDLLSEFFENGFVDNAEAELKRSDGSSYWVLMTYRPLPSAGPKARIVWIYDITERRSAELEIARQKQLLEATMENMDQAIGMWDKDYNLVALNEKLKTLIDLPPELLAVGTPVEDWYRHIAGRGEYSAGDAFGTGNVEEAVSARMASVRSGETMHYERTLADGRAIEIRRNVVDAGGFVSTYSDITERKEAERLLAEEREMLQIVLDNMAQGVVLYGADERVRLFNEQAQTLMDYSDGVLHVGAEFRDLVVDLQNRGALTSAGVDDSISRMRKGIQSRGVQEVEIQRKDDVSVQVLRRNLANGGFVATQTDITERKQVEKVIVGQRTMLEAVLENMDQGVIMYDADLKVGLINARVRKIFGIPDDILKEGASYYDLIDYMAARGDYGPGEVSELVENIKREVFKSTAIVFERELRNGTVVEIRRRPLPDGGTVTTHTDITARKQAEQVIEHQRSMLQAVLDNMDQGVIMYDADLKVRLFNNRARKISRFPDDVLKEGATNKDLFDFLITRGDMAKEQDSQLAKYA